MTTFLRTHPARWARGLLARGGELIVRVEVTLAI
jgi:hypothetical protein